MKIMEQFSPRVLFREFSKRAKRVHWGVYITRKIVILLIVALVFYLIEHFTHNKAVGKTQEMVLSSVVEHVLFGVPTTGEAA